MAQNGRPLQKLHVMKFRELLIKQIFNLAIDHLPTEIEREREREREGEREREREREREMEMERERERERERGTEERREKLLID